MRCPIFFFSVFIIMLASCDKDEPDRDDTSDSFKALTGKWAVDSTEIHTSHNGVPKFKSVDIASPDTMYFHLKNHVIRNTLGQVDTAFFSQNQAEYAIADLDFDGITDTTYIYFGDQGNTVDLKWIISHSKNANFEYKEEGIMYLSQ